MIGEVVTTPSVRSVRRRAGPDASLISLASLLSGEEIVLRMDVMDVRAMSEIPGTVTVSNYQLSFSTTDEPGYDQLFYRIPNAMLSNLKIERSNRVAGHSKDLREFVLECPSPEDARKLLEAIQDLAFCEVSKRFAFSHKVVPGGPTSPTVASAAASSSLSEDGWNVYDDRSEWNRLGLVEVGLRESSVNVSFSVCESYPLRCIVPANILDDQIRESASFRRLGRFPVITWRHKHTKSILFRSSQPLVGVASASNAQDENLVAEIAALCQGRLVVYDARKSRSALWHRLGGAGTESSRYKMATEVHFCDIRNVHIVRESYLEFIEVCRPLAKKTLRNLRRLEGVRQATWFVEMGKLLSSAVAIARDLDQAPTAVLVHCSDGLNRTTQLVSLVQILLDPFYRTIRGFAVLLEKEWINFGHRFAERLDLGQRSFPTAKYAPIFLQYLDCVWQLMQIVPTAFEYSERLLLCVCDSTLNARHGSFLFNSPKELAAMNARVTTPSVWTEILNQKAGFENANYKPVEGLLLTAFDANQLQLWEGYFLRYMGDDWAFRERYAELLLLNEGSAPAASPPKG